MIPSRLRAAICLLVAIALVTTPTFAKKPTNESVTASVSPSAAIAGLQKQQAEGDGVFVLQKEVDRLVLFLNPDGGGGCALATGINVLQCLRAVSGEPPLANPHQALLKLLSDQPDLLKGRVSNEGLSRLIARSQEWLGYRRVEVWVRASHRSPLRNGYPTWKASGPKLAVKPNQLTLLTYEVRTSSGEVRGRHFVVLRRVVGNKIDVLDPVRPHKDSSYVLEYKEDPKGGPTRVFLLRPVGVRVTTDVYELDTLFQISLRSETNEASRLRPTAAATEHLKELISQTADRLRGSNDFLNPRRWRQETAAFGLPGIDLPAEVGGSDWSA